MHKIAFAVTLFAGAAFTADRQVTYQGDLSPLNIKPVFDHGYVIAWDRNIDGDKQIQTISVFGPDGSRLYNTGIRLPDRKYISPLNAAADMDGTVAVVFRAGFAVFDPSGKQIHTVLTTPYEPSDICFAPDHSIWLQGRGGLGDAEYMIFRKYSPDGHELGRFVSSSKSAVKVPARWPPLGARTIRASANGIVALVPEDQPRPHLPLMLWMELDFEGNVVGRPGRHRYLFPWALTPQGTIYAEEGDNVPVFVYGGDKFLYLDNVSGNWQESSLHRPGSLAGADENGLIFELPDHRTLEWVAFPR